MIKTNSRLINGRLQKRTELLMTRHSGGRFWQREKQNRD